jgi:hypothetical protein
VCKYECMIPYGTLSRIAFLFFFSFPLCYYEGWLCGALARYYAFHLIRSDDRIPLVISNEP